MSDDPNVLVPVAEFTKILRRLSELERKVKELELRNPDNDAFDKAVFLQSSNAAKQAIKDIDFHFIFRDSIRKYDFKDAIDTALMDYDFREIIKNLDLNIHAERLLKSDQIINNLARRIVKRFGAAFGCLEDFETEESSEEYEEDEEDEE